MTNEELRKYALLTRKSILGNLNASGELRLFELQTKLDSELDALNTYIDVVELKRMRNAKDPD